MDIDAEVKALALHALKNAFYADFSELVRTYLAAAAGLDVDNLKEQLQDGLSIYGIDHKSTQRSLEIQSEAGFRQYSTIRGALEDNSSDEVHLEGIKVFERRPIGWYYVGGNYESLQNTE